jgi:hypothetical protein
MVGFLCLCSVYLCHPSSQDDWLADLNPESLLVIRGAYATPELAKAQPGDRCAAGQAQRLLCLGMHQQHACVCASIPARQSLGCRVAGSSWSGLATSVWILTPDRGPLCSTAPAR